MVRNVSDFGFGASCALSSSSLISLTRYSCTDVEEFIQVCPLSSSAFSLSLTRLHSSQIRSQLAKTQEQVTAIIEGADVLIWAIDRDWKVTFFSHPTFLGEGKEVVGRNVKDIWPESPLYAKCQEILDGVVVS